MLSSCSPSSCSVQLLGGRWLALAGCLPWSISAFTRGERSCFWKLFSGWLKKKKILQARHFEGEKVALWAVHRTEVPFPSHSEGSALSQPSI